MTESVFSADLGAISAPGKIFELPRQTSPVPGLTERIVDLVWTSDSQHLVVITRVDGTPARARLFLVDAAAPDTSATSPPVLTELLALPAEVLPTSATPDPTGHWLAFLAHATTTSNTNNALVLCVLELRAGGSFRDLADLGSAQRVPALNPVAWAPQVADSPAARLAFVAPAPAPPSTNGGGLFDFFGAFRSSAPPSGLFVSDLDTASLEAAQPHRVGNVIGVVAPVWRDRATLLGFAHQDDGTLTVRAIDAGTGAVRDTGAQLAAGTAQGSGLAARWDADHGRVVLVSPPSSSTPASAGAGGFQTWLVSFVASSTGLS